MCCNGDKLSYAFVFYQVLTNFNNDFSFVKSIPLLFGDISVFSETWYSTVSLIAGIWIVAFETFRSDFTYLYSFHLLYSRKPLQLGCLSGFICFKNRISGLTAKPSACSMFNSGAMSNRCVPFYKSRNVFCLTVDTSLDALLMNYSCHTRYPFHYWRLAI